MTHDELLEKLNFDHWSIQEVRAIKALRAVMEYSKELSQTDYRGNPPVEHYIAKELYKIIEKELI